MTPPTLTPPALHFLVNSFSYSCGSHIVTFTCTTDTPVHLYAHVTNQQPRVRRIPYVKRGAPFVLSSVTCFVELNLVEQTEPGDTLTHTFTIPLTAYGLIHYWYLSGTHAAIPSRSISQIFWQACPDPGWTEHMVLIKSARLHGLGTVDGAVYRQGVNLTWPDIHDNPGTTVEPDHIRTYIWLSSANTANRWTQLQRAKMTFDLAPIPPGSIIISAKYHIYVTQVNIQLGGAPAVGLVTGANTPWDNIITANYQQLGSVPISNPISYASIPIGTWQLLTISAPFLSIFTPGQKAGFGIRETTYDANNSPPPWLRGRSNYICYWTVDYVLNPALQPYLEIHYLGP